MKKILPFLIITIFILSASKKILAQTNTFPATGAAGIGTTTPDASALLEVKSTTKGVLFPRLTKSQRDAIATPATGLMIYQTNSTPGFYYYDGAAWKAVTQKSKGWSLTGNSGTDPSLNFIGTTDDQPLYLRVNNLIAGKIEASTSSVFFGVNAGINTTGQSNTLIGSSAGSANTTGQDNTAIGSSALSFNTTGLRNTALGSSALATNGIGSYNSAAGYAALRVNTSGANNVANGGFAMANNTTGNLNTAIGHQSLIHNTTASNNVAIGGNSLYSNTAGYSNVALGISALYKNTDRSNLVAIGDSALYNNGTGATSSYQATANTAIGSKALFSNTTGDANTANGYFAMYSNTTGFDNTAGGYRALYFNTGGISNTANGYYALYSNTTGRNNSATGSSALYSNTSADNNTANGASALSSNTGGSNNVATGYEALNSNILGSYNTATGGLALNVNTNGRSNTADGYKALYGGTTGHSNVAVGVAALTSNRDRSNIVAVGDSALFHNGFGVTYPDDASYNTALGSKTLFINTVGYANTASGYWALYSNTTGYENTASGDYALSSNTSGVHNTATGSDALSSNTSGLNNTATGAFALRSNTTGNYNTVMGADAGSASDNNTYCTFLGYDADQSINADLTNSMALGRASRVSGNNQVRIGNSNVTSIGGYADWSNISDGRYKNNVKENVPGLKFINLLKPVTYNLDVNGIATMFREDVSNEESKIAGEGRSVVNEKNAEAKALIQKARDAKSKIVNTGFIAQDVESAAKKLNYDFSAVDKPQDENGLYGLRYAQFVVPLVKAVQELSKANDDKDAKIDAQQQQIDELKLIVQTLQQNFNNCNPCGQQSISSNQSAVSNQRVTLTGKPETAKLEQNIPNPFNHTTTINYTLPQQFSSAKIIVTDNAGKVLKEINLPAGRQGISGSGKGSLNVEASTLTSGAYQYSLYVNGRLIDTKQMLLAK